MPPKGSKKRKSEAQTAPVEKRTSLPNSSGSSLRLVEKARAFSRPELVELTFEYTIPDLSLLPQKNGEGVCSPSFYAKSHENVKWYLKIYPNGRTEESIGYLDLFLVNKSVQENSILPVTAKYQLTILKNGEKTKYASSGYHEFTSSRCGLGWGQLLSLDKLKSDGNRETVLNLVCHLICEVKRVCLTDSSRIRENAGLLSQQQVVELNYDWVIEEPSFLSQQNGENFFSPVFAAKANGKISWRLKICPRGVNEESKDHLSLYLERVIGDPKESPVTVKSNWLVTKNGSEIFSKSDEIQTVGLAPLPSFFGWDKVVDLASIKRTVEICDPLNDAVDELKISCQLIYTL